MASEAKELEEIERIAVELAVEAGAISLKHWRRLTGFTTKSSTTDVLTEADLEVEAWLRREIERRFPRHTFVGEESAPEAAAAPNVASELPGNAWIADPIDGTVNFAHGLDQYSVSIGFWREGRPAVGVVYCPPRAELFVARRGAGSRRNGQPIGVSATQELLAALAVTGFGYDRREYPEKYLDLLRPLLVNTQGVRRFGSAALDLCSIATGRLDVYAERSLKWWDYAAGKLIVEEAGGRVTDFAGAPMRPPADAILATNGFLHDAMIGILPAP